VAVGVDRLNAAIGVIIDVAGGEVERAVGLDGLGQVPLAS